MKTFIDEAKSMTSLYPHTDYISVLLKVVKESIKEKFIQQAIRTVSDFIDELETKK
jgi:hypothetical protein